MQISQEIDVTRYAIRGYGAGEVTVTLPFNAALATAEALDAIGPGATRMRQEVLTRSLIVTPQALVRDWPPQTLEDLTAEHLEVIIALRPEVIILGVGARLRWPELDTLAPLLGSGVGYEIMDTAAACRTYNILMSDHRQVAAAIMMM